MARSRMIKPEFWTDEKSGMLNAFEKCLFIGMWNYADDEGLIKANPLYLKASVFPYDSEISVDDIQKALEKFQELDLVFLYIKNTQHFAWIIKFRVHQRIDKPQKPHNPPPKIDDRFRLAVFKRDSFICHICGGFTDLDACDITPPRVTHEPNFPSIDHLKPKAQGGTNYPSNLKCACISCNKGKRDRKDDSVNTLEDVKSIHGTFTDHSKNTPDETETETETETEVKLTPPPPPQGGKKDSPPPPNENGNGKIPFKEIVDDLNAVSGKNFIHSAAATQRLIKARWNQGYGFEDFQKVHRIKCAKWLHDPKFNDYIRPQTLYSTKFEAYVNERPPGLSARGVVSEKTERSIQNIQSWLEEEDAGQTIIQ